MKRAFTIIELMVTVAIIGILASVILVSLDRSQAKSRDAKRIADVNTIAKAYELYYQEKETYKVSGTGNSNYGWGYFNGLPDPDDPDDPDDSYNSYAKSINEGLMELGYLSGIIIDPSDPDAKCLKKLCYMFYYQPNEVYANDSPACATVFATLERPSGENLATTSSDYAGKVRAGTSIDYVNYAAYQKNYAVTIMP